MSSALPIVWAVAWLLLAQWWQRRSVRAGAADPTANRGGTADGRGTAVGGRGPAPTRRATRVVTLGFLPIGAVAVLVSPGVAGLLVVLGAWSVAGRRRRLARRALGLARRDLARLLDLVGIVMASGGNLDQALTVAGRSVGPLAAALDERASQSLEERLRAIDDVVDLPGLRLAPTLIAAWEQGEPLMPVVHRLADDTRAWRRHQAEAAARRAPVKALAPLMLTTLPAFVLLTVAPLLAGGLRALRLDPLR